MALEKTSGVSTSKNKLIRNSCPNLRLMIKISQTITVDRYNL